MNSRQAAKAAAKRIEDLEFRVAMNILDIRDYNKVIEELILQKSPCPWCEDYNECQLEAKKLYGCPEWLLHNNAKRVTEVDVDQEEKLEFGGGDEG
jgi:hypothetical protein